MKVLNLGIIVFITLFFLTSIAAATTIDVGSGYPYNSIQDGINAANAGDTVYVHANTYTVSTINLKSGIVLKGENPDTTIIHGTATSGGMQGSRVSLGWLMCSGLSNVEITGFSFTSDAVIKDGGKGEARNCILLKNCNNITINNNKCLKYQYNDFVKIHSSNGITVYNNTIQSGHDGIEFLSGSYNCEAYNNDIEVRINCGMRVDDCRDIHLHHNIITGQSGTGWCIFEIQDHIINCEIDHNIAHDWSGSGGNAFTQSVHASVSNLSVHDNVMWNVGDIGIGTSVNNIVNPSNKDIANWESQGYGPSISSKNIASGVIPSGSIGINTNIYSDLVNIYNQNGVNVVGLELTKSPRAEMGVGKYQNIMTFNLLGYANKISISNPEQSLYWYYPDIISKPYESIVTNYQPSVLVS